MNPDEPRGWWNKHLFDGSNAGVKPRPSPLIRDCMYGPNFSTNGTFTGRHGPAKTSTTRRSDRPSPRICDDQFVGAACPQNHDNRAMRAANSLRSNKPSGFFHASNEEDYECETMQIESHDDYSHNTYEATKPKSVEKETKIESLLQKLLDSHEKACGEIKTKIDEVSTCVSKMEQGLHCIKSDLQDQIRTLRCVDEKFDRKIEDLQQKILANPTPSVDWEKDHGSHVLDEERDESDSSLSSLEENVESKVTFYNVKSLQSPKTPPRVKGEPEKMSKSPPHDQPPGLRCESLRPHRRAPGMRQPDPRPHGRDSAMRPDPSPHPNPDDSPPHNQASSVRQDLSWPHTRDLIVWPVTCSTPSFDSKILSPNEGPRPMSPTNVTSHHHGDGGNGLEESKTLVVKSPNELQERKGEETEVLYKKGKLLQNPREKGKSLSISTCGIPSHILQETKRRESNNKDELMGESKELAKSDLKTNRVAPMGREEQEPFGPTLATDILSARNPTLPHTEGEGSETPTPCSQNVSPLQENQEGEAVTVEEGTMVDLKKTQELNPKFLETMSNHSSEETKEEDELTSTPKMDRTTTLRSLTRLTTRDRTTIGPTIAWPDHGRLFIDRMAGTGR